MSKIFYSAIFILLIILMFIPTVAALKTSSGTIYQEKIEGHDYFWGHFSTLDKEKDMSNEVRVKFNSDLPVNLYIFESGDLDTDSPNYYKADYSKIEMTSEDFSYYLEEDISYWVVISNPNDNVTATVRCEITEYFGSSSSDATYLAIIGSWAMLISIIATVIIVAIIAVIYLIIKKRKDHKRDYNAFFKSTEVTPLYDPTLQQQDSYDDYYSQENPPRPPYNQY